MKTYTISKLAKSFRLSRSTLLYYDRIGLLQATARSSVGYRLYTESDHDRLDRICNLRDAGLSLEEIKEMLASDTEDPSVPILENRLKELSGEIIALKNQQRLLTSMLKNVADAEFEPSIDKKAWIEMLKAAGMDEKAMTTWHKEFEKRAPDGHLEFLLSLGISEDEARRIQERSRKK